MIALIGVSWFQALLNGIGAVVAWLYDLIPNYGVAIIVLTLAIRILLLPLAVKQIRSMHAMQAIGPKQKEIQRKYKGNRVKIQEETMKLYREEGVNPLSGCLPILAQFPVLIALFAVLSVPNGLPHVRGSAQNPTRLYQDILRTPTPSGLKLFGANLVCSASEAGRQVSVKPNAAYPGFTKKDCGKGAPVRIPYYFFLAAMVATTYYQQRQMQRASPPGQNQQQQMIMRIMPAFFGFIGFTFPAALVVYWTTTNVVQIIQQHFMLPKRAPTEAGAPKAQGDGGKRARGQRGSTASRFDGGRARGTGGSASRKGQSTPSKATPPQGENAAEGSQPRPKQQGDRGRTGGGTPGQGNRAGRGPGGRDGGNRKKRRKR